MTTEGKTTANSTYPKVAVQWLNQALCFYQSLCLVDSEVLQNRHLRVASKRYQQAKMTTIIRNRTLEISVAGLTVVLLALTIMTYFLDQNKSNWICGPVLFLMELVALGLQIVLTVLIWKATSKKTKFVLLSLSILMIGFITYGFVNFNLNCT